MKEIQGRVTICRYAKRVSKLEALRGEGYPKYNINKKYLEDCWYLWITHLYSVVHYSENEYDSSIDESLSPFRCPSNRPKRYMYAVDKTMQPMLGLSFVKKQEHDTKSFYGRKFYIAVKEVIIEWEDYQEEIAGYVHCEAREDLVGDSEWYNKPNTPWFNKPNDNKYQNPSDSKQLLRFVKSPGLKTTNIKICKEDLEFFPIDLENCRKQSVIEEELVKATRYLEVRREHHLGCELRPLFESTDTETNEILPIKHAHITVEIYLQ